ncbi:MAG TPA: hypothetical protein DEA95_07560, partial [Nitrospiraceae bacterium]|nr:hypothetical protein [Nitrospiraceae bacterium]
LLLVRTTGRKLAWILISTAMVLMTWRRIVSFISILTTGKHVSLDIPEVIALIISILMLLGVLLIRDYFRSINLADARRKKAEEALRKAHDELEQTVKERTSELSVANEHLRQRHLEVSALYKVSSVISKSIRMDKLLGEVLNAISKLEVFTVDKGMIFVVEGNRMRLAAHLGHSGEFLDLHKDMMVGDCLCGIVAKTGEILISANAEKDSRHKIMFPDSTPHGHFVVPFKTKDRVEGVLDLHMPVDAEIDEEKVKLMAAIGNQMGIAIENARLYEETKELSLHDPLTGLWNHNEIRRILQQELARAEREGGCVSVIMADIDHFKSINDTYGHLAGDAVLRMSAKRMLSTVRSYDAMGRYGGEEFMVVLPACDRQYIAAAAERLRISINSSSMDTSEGMIPVAISLGVAASGKERRCDADAIVRAADSALYRAKNNGRNRVEFAFDDEIT